MYSECSGEAAFCAVLPDSSLFAYYIRLNGIITMGVLVPLRGCVSSFEWSLAGAFLHDAAICLYVQRLSMLCFWLMGTSSRGLTLPLKHVFFLLIRAALKKNNLFPGDQGSKIPPLKVSWRPTVCELRIRLRHIWMIFVWSKIPFCFFSKHANFSSLDTRFCLLSKHRFWVLARTASLRRI